MLRHAKKTMIIIVTACVTIVLSSIWLRMLSGVRYDSSEAGNILLCQFKYILCEDIAKIYVIGFAAKKANDENNTPYKEKKLMIFYVGCCIGIWESANIALTNMAILSPRQSISISIMVFIRPFIQAILTYAVIWSAVCKKWYDCAICILMHYLHAIYPYINFSGENLFVSVSQKLGLFHRDLILGAAIIAYLQLRHAQYKICAAEE